MKVCKVVSTAIVAFTKENEPHSLFFAPLAEAAYRVEKGEADRLEQVRAQFESAVAAG